jgi:hypothetical protein
MPSRCGTIQVIEEPEFDPGLVNVVSCARVPESITVGDTFTVESSVRNANNDFDAVGEVVVLAGGTVIGREDVEVPADSTGSVTVSVDAPGRTGQYEIKTEARSFTGRRTNIQSMSIETDGGSDGCGCGDQSSGGRDRSSVPETY